jgi:hypothetical protein
MNDIYSSSWLMDLRFVIRLLLAKKHNDRSIAYFSPDVFAWERIF